MDSIHRMRHEKLDIVTAKECRFYTELLHLTSVVGAIWTIFSFDVGLEYYHYVLVIIGVLFVGHAFVTWVVKNRDSKLAFHNVVDMVAVSAIPFGFLIPFLLTLDHIFNKKYFSRKKESSPCLAE